MLRAASGHGCNVRKRVRIRKGAALSYHRVKSGVWGFAPAGCAAEPREEFFGVFNALLRTFHRILMVSTCL